MLMYYVMTTMWRALNQRGLRRVCAQSLIQSFLNRFLGCYGISQRVMSCSAPIVHSSPISDCTSCQWAHIIKFGQFTVIFTLTTFSMIRFN